MIRNCVWRRSVLMTVELNPSTAQLLDELDVLI
jgi:hypothetical protein